MADDEFTQDLFRFLQLLCEGHNNGEEECGQDTRRPWGRTLERRPSLATQTSARLSLSFLCAPKKRSAWGGAHGHLRCMGSVKPARATGDPVPRNKQE